MRISLINAYSTRNVGDAAIYHGLATLARSARPLTCQLEEDNRLQVPGIAFHAGPRPESDLYVSVGGDIFNNARPWSITRTFLHNLKTLSSPPPSRTILFGQSIPRSCRSLAFQMLSRRLRSLASVTVRDRESFQRLRQAGVPARLSYDAAFILRPGELGRFAARARYAQIGVEAEQAAVISLRSFDKMYPVDNQDFLHRIVRLCQLFTQSGLTPVVLMQSDASGSDNDRAMLKELMQRVPTVRYIDPFALALYENPWETAIGVLQFARVAVAVRYHTGVFRALGGRAAYNLFYSNKGADLVSRLGMPGSSIENFDPDRDFAAILASSEQAFDIATVRSQLKQDFEHAWSAPRTRRAA